MVAEGGCVRQYPYRPWEYKPQLPPCADDRGHKFVMSQHAVLCERCGFLKDGNRLYPEWVEPTQWRWDTKQ